MSWFNIYGLIIMAVIMIPNIIASLKFKDMYENKYDNKAIIMLEQIGRFSSFALMIINIPYLCLGYFVDFGETLYILVNSVLCFLYCLCWRYFGISREYSGRLHCQFFHRLCSYSAE